MQQQIEVLWAPQVAVNGTNGVEIFTGTARACHEEAFNAANELAAKIGGAVLWHSAKRVCNRQKCDIQTV